VFALENDYAVCFVADVIGVVTGLSAEREYVRRGKITKMIIVELTDHRWIVYLFLLLCLFCLYAIFVCLISLV
jgi:hypothetical protein